MTSLSLVTKSLYRQLLEYVSYISQLRQVIRWAKEEYGTSGFSIYVSTVDFKTTLRFGAYTEPEPTLIFCTPQHSNKELYAPASFKCIFSSFELEVWERTQDDHTSPLRHGLSEDERQIAIATARGAALCFIENKCSKPAFAPTSSDIEKRFAEATTVGVAIWVDGILRASIIESGHSLEKGLRRAGRRLTTSTRTKPLTKEEIEHGVIEITIFNSLALELTQRAHIANVIVPTNGYKAVARGKTGWYIPEAFNVSTPPAQNLKSFLKQLAYRKLGISKNLYPEVRFYTFSVHVFIESKGASAIIMDGPVPGRDLSLVAPTTLIEAGTQTGHRLAQHLLSLQQADGNIIPLLNPTTNTFGDVNWVTLSCTAWALAEFGKATHTAAYLSAAELAVSFIETSIYSRELSQSHKISSLIYYIRAKKVLSQNYDRALSVLEKELSTQPPYEPILYANIGSLLATEHSTHPHFLEQSKKYAHQVYSDFIKQRASNTTFSLARYPELIQTFLHLYAATQDPAFESTAAELALWYQKKQLPSGAFPARHNSQLLPYTRGTGKIFEILSLFYPEQTSVLIQTLTWINQLEYRAISQYCVAPHLHKQTIGGLRASVLDTTITIDASAHVLIGISRLVNKSI